MNNLFSIIFTTARAKVTRLVAKIKLYSSSSYRKARITSKLRQWFAELFDIKPRNSKDYYTVFRWMVSKRLAFALTVVIGLCCGYYIYSLMPVSIAKTTPYGIRTYKYSSPALRFFSGECSILDKNGRLAYTGSVEKAMCRGNGTLFDKDGSRVYVGEFDNNMFNGSGTSYYPDGVVKHSGHYVDNMFEGTGKIYRSNGTISYNGNFSVGMKSGQGTLYNESGSEIFSGSFLNNNIVFEEFIGKTTDDIAEMYSGSVDIYSSTDENSVFMRDINAVYTAADGSDSIADKWTVKSVIVLSDSFRINSTSTGSIQRLTNILGTPSYLGSTKINLAEAVAINSLKGDSAKNIGKVTMSLTDEFDEVHTVTGYDDDYELYIYSYRYGGLIYTFYCAGAGVDEFLIYSIEAA